MGRIATDILAKIPAIFELDKIRKKFGLDISPTTVVLLQELERYNLLIDKMRKSLAELKRALVGEVGMSNELDELSRALFNGQQPRMWKRLAPDSLKNLGTSPFFQVFPGPHYSNALQSKILYEKYRPLHEIPFPISSTYIFSIYHFLFIFTPNLHRESLINCFTPDPRQFRKLDPAFLEAERTIFEVGERGGAKGDVVEWTAHP